MILGIIPARYASTRFPAKPLADIAGKSMIQRVYEQVKKSALIHAAVVATDNQKIFDHVLGFGFSALVLVVIDTCLNMQFRKKFR